MKATRLGALIVAAGFVIEVAATMTSTASAATTYNPTVRLASTSATGGAYLPPGEGVPAVLTNPAVICGYSGYSRATSYARADGSYLPGDCLRPAPAPQSVPSPTGASTN
jgi:hypothetical protein